MGKPETSGNAAPAAPRHVEIIERLRGAAQYEYGNLNEDQRNLYYAAADAIESAHGLLHGAGVSGTRRFGMHDPANSGAACACQVESLEEYARRVAHHEDVESGTFAFLIARNPRKGTWPRWRGVIRRYYSDTDFLGESFGKYDYIVLGPISARSRFGLLWALRFNVRIQGVYPRSVPIFKVSWAEVR